MIKLVEMKPQFDIVNTVFQFACLSTWKAIKWNNVSRMKRYLSITATFVQYDLKSLTDWDACLDSETCLI